MRPLEVYSISISHSLRTFRNKELILSLSYDTTILQSLLAGHFNKNQLLQLLHCTVAAWCRNVETNATSQIWEENPRNPCASTSNLKLQTRGGQVANAWWDKTGSGRATNEGE